MLLLAIMFCNARVTLSSIEWAVLNKMTDLWTFIAFQTLIWSLTVTLPETFCISKLSTTTSRVSPSGRCKIAFVRKQCFISTNAVVVFFFFSFLVLFHPRRPRGSQSGREKRRDESFQAQAEEPLGTDSHRTISKRSSECWLLIGHKKCFVLLCPISEQHLLSSFHDGYYLATVAHFIYQACAYKGNFHFLLS